MKFRTKLIWAFLLVAILPICMYCKSIRDDSGTLRGKGKWLPVEEYLLRQEGTFVSHGCCPRCMKENF
jgi:hypothetical protein